MSNRSPWISELTYTLTLLCHKRVVLQPWKLQKQDSNLKKYTMIKIEGHKYLHQQLLSFIILVITIQLQLWIELKKRRIGPINKTLSQLILLNLLSMTYQEWTFLLPNLHKLQQSLKASQPSRWIDQQWTDMVLWSMTECLTEKQPSIQVKTELHHCTSVKVFNSKQQPILGSYPL